MKVFEKLDEAFNLIGKGMEDVFKNPPLGVKITTKTTSVDLSNVTHITFRSWKNRLKASWRILTRGEITIKPKENKK